MEERARPRQRGLKVLVRSGKEDPSPLQLEVVKHKQRPHMVLEVWQQEQEGSSCHAKEIAQYPTIVMGSPRSWYAKEGLVRFLFLSGTQTHRIRLIVIMGSCHTLTVFMHMAIFFSRSSSHPPSFLPNAMHTF